MTRADCRTEQRVARVMEMWRLRRDEHLNNREIAARLGVLPTMVPVELHRMRTLGFDVPCSPYNGFDTRPSRAAALDDSGMRLGKALAARGITPESTRAAA